MKTTGNENNNFTVVPACLANGSKLKPIDICKRKTMPKEPIPSQIVVHVREKGWMDQVGMKLWNEKVWRRHEGGLLKKKSILVYDMFKTHLMDSIFFKLRDHNTDVAIIPGGLTSQLQPLDVSLNKPFKEKVCVMWSERIAGNERREFTKGGKLRKKHLSLCGATGY